MHPVSGQLTRSEACEVEPLVAGIQTLGPQSSGNKPLLLRQQTSVASGTSLAMKGSRLDALPLWQFFDDDRPRDLA